jgi:hypothetical protein
LRVFTELLAENAGLDLDWSVTSSTPDSRNALYAARDVEVIARHFGCLKNDDKRTPMEKKTIEQAQVFRATLGENPLQNIIRAGLSVSFGDQALKLEERRLHSMPLYELAAEVFLAAPDKPDVMAVRLPAILELKSALNKAALAEKIATDNYRNLQDEERSLQSEARFVRDSYPSYRIWLHDKGIARLDSLTSLENSLGKIHSDLQEYVDPNAGILVGVKRDRDILENLLDKSISEMTAIITKQQKHAVEKYDFMREIYHRREKQELGLQPVQSLNQLSNVGPSI